MEMTYEEYVTSFFTEEEYAAMRLRNKMMTRCRSSIPNGVDDDDFAYESRRDRIYRKRRVQESRVNVLLEQELQNSTNRNNPANLAEVLRGYSVQSAKLAFCRAYDNAIEVHDTCQWVGCDIQEGVDPMDRPSSPTSTIDPLPYDYCMSKSSNDDPRLDVEMVDFLPLVH